VIFDELNPLQSDKRITMDHEQDYCEHPRRGPCHALGFGSDGPDRSPPRAGKTILMARNGKAALKNSLTPTHHSAC